MNVSDIMTAKPVTIHQDDSLKMALELMEKHQFRHLPVMNSSGQLVGIVSDRDLRTALNSPLLSREAWEDDAQIKQVKMRAIMTPAPVVVEPDADADEAARLMLDHRVSCLPVVLAETLVGIITTSDIIMAFRDIYRRMQRQNQLP